MKWMVYSFYRMFIIIIFFCYGNTIWDSKLWKKVLSSDSTDRKLNLVGVLIVRFSFFDKFSKNKEKLLKFASVQNLQNLF